MILSIEELTINLGERKIYIDNDEIKLTQKEFDMLYLLAKKILAEYLLEKRYFLKSGKKNL